MPLLVPLLVPLPLPLPVGAAVGVGGAPAVTEEEGARRGALVAVPMSAKAWETDTVVGVGVGVGCEETAGAAALVVGGADGEAEASRISACMAGLVSVGGRTAGGGVLVFMHVTTRCMPMMNSGKSSFLSPSTSHKRQMDFNTCPTRYNTTQHIYTHIYTYTRTHARTRTYMHTHTPIPKV